MGYKCSQERNKRLKKLASKTPGYVGGGGAWLDEEKNRYIRCYRGKRSPFLKRLGAKKIRRDKDNIYQKSEYRRVFDFWWELY